MKNAPLNLLDHIYVHLLHSMYCTTEIQNIGLYYYDSKAH